MELRPFAGDQHDMGLLGSFPQLEEQTNRSPGFALNETPGLLTRKLT